MYAYAQFQAICILAQAWLLLVLAAVAKLLPQLQVYRTVQSLANLAGSGQPRYVGESLKRAYPVDVPNRQFALYVLA